MTTFKRATVFSLYGAALALAVSSACAAPIPGSSDDAVFYAPPTALSGNTGDLLSYRAATVKLGAGAPSVKAWNVVYQSKTAFTVNNAGTVIAPRDNAVSGTVIVPAAAWTGAGPRPVILYAIGTHGLASNCSPSRQMAAGTDYEATNIVAALNAGYAVLVTDYAGYLNGQKAVYLVGESQAHSTLDIFRAAVAIPGAGIDPKAKVGVWGYSQGGQTAAKVAEIASTYAPDIGIVGVAAGGIPAVFRTVAPNLDGNLGAAFLASAVSGLANEYGRRVPIDQIASADGKTQLAKLATECVFAALFDLQDKTLSSFTIGNQPLNDLLDIVDDVLTEQNLGTATPTMPMYQFHGAADEFIQLSQDFALKQQYCQNNVKVAFDLYPSEHITTLFQSGPKVLSWMADRFSGKPAPSTCNITKAPTDTSLPGGGDFKVALNAWPLTGTVDLKTLKQTVNLPSGSTFTATTNITHPDLTGSMYVPDFKQSLKIIGIGAQIGMRISPVGNATGTAALDTTGILAVKGTVNADITVTSIWGIPFGDCKTVTPIKFDLNSTGPVAGLGTGLTFSGTTTFPQVKGCIISAVLTALMSGPGQVYTFNVKPPAPVAN